MREEEGGPASPPLPAALLPEKVSSSSFSSSSSLSKPPPESCTVIPANPDLALPAAPGAASAPRNSAVPGKSREAAREASVVPPCAASLKTFQRARSLASEKEARRRWEGGCGSRTVLSFFFFGLVF